MIILVFPPLSDQAQQLWSARFEMFERVQQFLISKGILSERLTLQQAVERAPGGSAGGAFGTVLSAVAGVLGGIFGLVTVLILTFYLLVDSGSLHRFLIQLFPRRDRARVDAAARTITMKVSAWLGGQLVLAAIIGSTSALGLWLLGIPFFYVLALISAIGEMIPIVGPVLAAIPAIAVAGTVSLKKVLFVIVFFIVQQQIENHLLVPKVMERQVGVSAVTVIVALLIGGKLMGVAGAILAVPTAAILQVLLTEWQNSRDSDSKSPRVRESANPRPPARTLYCNDATGSTRVSGRRARRPQAAEPLSPTARAGRRAEGAHVVRPQVGRQSLLQQLPGTDNPPAAAAEGARGD